MATRYSVEISVNKYNSKTGDIFAESNYKNNSDDENSISQFQFNVLRDIRTNDLDVAGGVGENIISSNLISIANDDMKRISFENKDRRDESDNILRKVENLFGAPNRNYLLLKELNLALNLKLKEVNEEKHIEKVLYVFEEVCLKNEDRRAEEELLYTRNTYRITHNLKASWLNGKPKLQFTESEETKNLPKLLVYEDENIVFFLSFTYTMQFAYDGNLRPIEDEDDYESNISVKEIKVPYSFDIKYTNLFEWIDFQKGIKPNKEFVFDIYKRDVFNPYENKTENISYSIKGKIIPYSDDNDTLKTQLILRLTFKKNSVKNTVGTSTRIYNHYVDFGKDDVIELKLKDREPIAEGITEEEMLEHDKDFIVFQNMLREQSIIIRLQK